MCTLHHEWEFKWRDYCVCQATSAPSLISCFFFLLFLILHSFASRLPFFWNVPGLSFPFPGSWSELLAAWWSGQKGERETQMVQFSCRPVCLAQTSAKQVKKDLSTHADRAVYLYTLQTYTSTIRPIHSHSCTVCVQYFNTQYCSNTTEDFLNTRKFLHINNLMLRDTYGKKMHRYMEGVLCDVVNKQMNKYLAVHNYYCFHFLICTRCQKPQK